MRSLIRIVAIIGALQVTIVSVQSQAQLPPCAETCYNNLLAIAPSLGCPGPPDPVCLCKNANFGYGLRDCAQQACGASDAAAVIAYGTAYCASTASGGGSPLPKTSDATQMTITLSNATQTTTTSGTAQSGTTSKNSSPASTPSLSTASLSVSGTTSAPSSTLGPTDVAPIAETTSSNGGLTSGSKAGIGVGVVFAVVLAALLVFFCLRRRKQQRDRQAERNLETNETAAEGGHELITPANIHEMDGEQAADSRVFDLTSEKRHETFRDRKVEMLPTVPELPATDPNPIDSAAHISEMPRSPDRQPMNARSDLEQYRPVELGANSPPKSTAELHSQSLDAGSTSAPPAIPPKISLAMPQKAEVFREQESPSQAPVASSFTSDTGEPLESLRRRMDKVREEKERLERIQQLQDLEAALQREIMAQERQSTGMS